MNNKYTIIFLFIVWFIGTGCQSMELPDSAWLITLTNKSGELLIVKTSAKYLFSNPNSIAIEKINTISTCLGGWLDRSTGKLATLEHEDNKSVIRLYDKSLKIIAEYRFDPLDVDLPYNLSYPTLSMHANKIAFVNSAGTIVVGNCVDDQVIYTDICTINDIKDSIPDIYCYWIASDRLVVGYFFKILIIDVSDKSYHMLGNGTLMGTSDDQLVLAHHDYGAAQVSLDNKVVKFLGRIKANIPYAGNNIHRVSPDSEYVAYDVSLHGINTLAIQHIASGRRVYIKQIENPRWIGSWNADSDAVTNVHVNLQEPPNGQTNQAD